MMLLALESPNVPDQIKLDWNTIRRNAPFPQEAFQFVREGLAHTVKIFHGDGTSSSERHVSGPQLCLGLRDYAVQTYGMLALTVLSRWGIRSTADFGRIVFAMIDAGLMRKSDEDNLSDFVDVFEFEEAFATAQLLA
jgi:uncharacterized repeat protein (TIGR04138 family)